MHNSINVNNWTQ